MELNITHNNTNTLNNTITNTFTNKLISRPCRVPPSEARREYIIVGERPKDSKYMPRQVSLVETCI